MDEDEKGSLQRRELKWFYACENRQVLLQIREMQIATKTRYWISLITLAKIKESNKPCVDRVQGLCGV